MSGIRSRALRQAQMARNAERAYLAAHPEAALAPRGTVGQAQRDVERDEAEQRRAELLAQEAAEQRSRGWRCIDDEGLYEVDRHGTVRRVGHTRAVKPYASSGGQLVVRMRRRDGTTWRRMVHALVGDAWLGPIAPGHRWALRDPGALPTMSNVIAIPADRRSRG